MQSEAIMQSSEGDLSGDSHSGGEARTAVYDLSLPDIPWTDPNLMNWAVIRTAHLHLTSHNHHETDEHIFRAERLALSVIEDDWADPLLRAYACTVVAEAERLLPNVRCARRYFRQASVYFA